MPVALEKNTFAQGQVSKELWARRDLAKYQTAVKKARNMCVLLEGGLTRCPGTRFVAPLKDQSRIGRYIPFRFSPTDAYMLVFNAGVMRVFRNGGEVLSGVSVYETAIPYADVDFPNIKFSQSYDVIYISCKGYTTRVLRRLAHDNWTFSVFYPVEAPLEPLNADVSKTITPSSDTGTVTLNASFAAFQSAHVDSVWRLDEDDLSTVPLWAAGETVGGSAYRRWNGRIYQNTSGSPLVAGPNAPTHDDGVVTSGGGQVAWAFISNTGTYVRITGFTSSTQVTAVVQGRIAASILSGTYRWSEAAWSGVRGHPEGVFLLDQRLGFIRDNQLWLSRPGDYTNFEIDQTDASALTLSLVSPDGSFAKIAWVGASGIIVVGCAGSEWIIRGPSIYDVLKVDTVRAIPSGSEGSCPHEPLVFSGGVIFIGNSRRKLHYAVLDGVGEQLTVQETTLFSRDILLGLARQLAFQRDPNRIIWVSLQSGTLVALTFRPDQEVMGFATRDFHNGFVEEIATIPAADGEDVELWLIVRRTIGGVTKRYIEVMQPFFRPLSEDASTCERAWFFDSALEYNNPSTPVTTLSGLGHLEGQTVGWFANGRLYGTAVVASGAITVPEPVTQAVVGLPLPYRIDLLRIDLDAQGGSSRLSAKQARQVGVDVVNSYGGYVEVNGGYREPLTQSGSALLGTALPAYTKTLLVSAASPSDRELNISIYDDRPFPFTLSGITPDIDVHGG